MSLIDWVYANGRDLLALSAVAGGIVLVTDTTLPSWSPFVAIVAIAALIGGYWAAGRIEDLIPEERGIFLISLPAKGTEGFGIYELNTPAWEDLDVEGNGSLKEIPEAIESVYFCRAYDRGENVAEATYLAEATTAELRSYEGAIAYAVDQLSRESDMFWTLRASFRQIVRQVSQSIAREQIAISEEVSLPQGGLIEERMSKILDDYEDDPLSVEQDTPPWMDDNGDGRSPISISVEGPGNALDGDDDQEGGDRE